MIFFSTFAPPKLTLLFSYECDGIARKVQLSNTFLTKIFDCNENN
jgi:hypothetical protein